MSMPATTERAAREYTPRQGSFAAKAYEALAAAPGGELNSATLADQIGAELAALPALLAVPRTHGFFVTERRLGMNWWRLGTGEPPPRKDLPAEEARDAEVEASERKLKAAERLAMEEAQRKVAVSSVFELAARRAETAPPQPQDDAPLRAALWSDGVLVICANGITMQLQAEQTRTLVDYLDRLAAQPDDAAS